MLKGDAGAFPPSPFDERDWLDLLRVAGLQSALSADTLVEFAQRIADHRPR